MINQMSVIIGGHDTQLVVFPVSALRWNTNILIQSMVSIL